MNHRIALFPCCRIAFYRKPVPTFRARCAVVASLFAENRFPLLGRDAQNNIECRSCRPVLPSSLVGLPRRQMAMQGLGRTLPRALGRGGAAASEPNARSPNPGARQCGAYRPFCSLELQPPTRFFDQSDPHNRVPHSSPSLRHPSNSSLQMRCGDGLGPDWVSRFAGSASDLTA